MTIEPRSPQAGWYPNKNGQLQWWDGREWGPLAPPVQPIYVPSAATKSAGTSYLLWVFLGGFAAHRFYLRRYVSAVIFNLIYWSGWIATSTGTGLGWGVIAIAVGAMWLIVDLFLIPGMAREEPA